MHPQQLVMPSQGRLNTAGNNKLSAEARRKLQMGGRTAGNLILDLHSPHGSNAISMKDRVKIEDRGSNLITGVVTGEHEEGNAVSESVDIDLKQMQMKPVGFAATQSSQMFDF